MALANFIDRAAASASQVLADFDLGAFTSRLGDHVVGVGFDAVAAASAEGRATLDLTIRLLARLYPRVAIVPIGEEPGGYAVELAATAKAINPGIDIEHHHDGVTVALAIGTSASPFGCRKLYIGSDGWRVRLSTTAPVGCGGGGNPVGAGAAACFGAANVFRAIFADQLERGDADEDIDLSMLTFTREPDEPQPGSDSGVDIGSTHLVGAGAIGNGFLWALGAWAGIRGRLDVIDHEELDLSNLQRYVLGEQSMVDMPKTDIAVSFMGFSGITVVPHRDTWQSYAAKRADWRFERVAVALDSARDRVAVQGSLPRWIANAWTQQTDLGVSRHTFGEGACLVCLYMPAGKTRDQHVLVAEELGMPEAELEVRTLLQLGSPVDEAFVRRVATALEVPFTGLVPFVGQPVASFHQNAICGGLVMKLTGGKAKVRAVVPMSFQLALAGIMLAAEVVKHATGARPAPTTSTRIDLLRPLASYLHDPKARDRSGRCICADQDFLSAFASKYSV